MPLPAAAIGAIVQGGASLIGQGLNWASTSINNAKSRKWNEQMYARQRQDALADWNMQNEYNSPASQMKRFKEAGLNPNLIYGQSNEGGVVRSTNVESWRPDAPSFDLSGVGNAFMQFYDTRIKQAQYDNLKAANTIAVQDAALRAAQVAATQAGTAKTQVETGQSEFNLSQARALQNVSLQTAEQQLRKLTADTEFTLAQNERAAATTAQSLTQGAENILILRQQQVTNRWQQRQIQEMIENLKKDRELKQLDINLKKIGVQPGDELWQRILAQLLGQEGGLPAVKERVKGATNKAWNSFKMDKIFGYK